MRFRGVQTEQDKDKTQIQLIRFAAAERVFGKRISLIVLHSYIQMDQTVQMENK